MKHLSTYFKKLSGLVIMAGAAAIAPCVVHAQLPVQVTTTSVPFLQITPDTRSGGMGNIGLATSPDADASFHNLSKAIFSEDKANVSVNYTPQLRNVTSGISFTSLAGTCKLDDVQAVTGSLRYFSIKDVPVTDHSGAVLGVYRPNEFALDLGYSRKLSDKFSAGVAFRYIYSKLIDGSVDGTAYKAGNAFAGDLTGYYNGLDNNGEGFTAGVALSNLGSKIGYTSGSNKAFIPASAGIGGAYTKKYNEDHKFTFGLEANKLLVPAAPINPEAMADYYNTGVMKSWFQSFDNTAYKLGAGIEYTYVNLLSLRAGYTFDGDDIGNSKYITAGLGIKYEGFDLNFAYLIPSGMSKVQSAMANTIRFGLVYHFENKK